MHKALSVLIPANNEARHIGACLDHLCASFPVPEDVAVQVIVIANGCTDSTVAQAQNFQQRFADKGWTLQVRDLSIGDKLAALRAGEAAAQGAVLIYLDADVRADPGLICELFAALDTHDPLYASGQVRLVRAQTWVTRTYAGFYAQVPFLRQKAPGCGVFAVNQAGRAAWQDWPQIISDDTFVRLCFAPDQRIQVSAGYDWPLVEGLANLIKVRRRQNAGVDEIAERFPQLLVNDIKSSFTPPALLRAIAKAPLGFAIYALVALVVKLTPGDRQSWSRGR